MKTPKLVPRELGGNIFAMNSVRFSIPNGGGLPYESDRVEMTVGADGHIHFSDESGENFIYFYPQQVPHLKRAIAAWNRRRA